MKLFHKRGGGQPDFISLIQKCYAPKKARTNQNKDFIKAVRGGGVTILWKVFINFRFFLNDGFPYAPIIIQMICEPLIVKLRLRCCLVAGPAKG